jgi:hypothetical protein
MACVFIAALCVRVPPTNCIDCFCQVHSSTQFDPTFFPRLLSVFAHLQNSTCLSTIAMPPNCIGMYFMHFQRYPPRFARPAPLLLIPASFQIFIRRPTFFHRLLSVHQVEHLVGSSPRTSRQHAPLTPHATSIISVCAAWLCTAWLLRYASPNQASSIHVLAPLHSCVSFCQTLHLIYSATQNMLSRA